MVQLVAQGFKQSIQWRRLNTKPRNHIYTGLIWPHLHSRFFLSQFWVRSPTDFKFFKHILLYSQGHITGLPPPHSLPPKGVKIRQFDAPIDLSCHFSVRTHHKGTFQPELGILIYLQGQYLSTTSKVNFSRKQSTNVKILFKCVMSIYPRTRAIVVGDRGSTNTLRD